MDISTADQDWQRRWFSMPAERRAHIEGHLELCKELLGVLERLDMNDRGQYPIWRKLRESSGWSQKKLGPAVGLHRTEISRYEKGERIPTRQNGPTYRALMWNLAADQYHSHLVRLGWALFWAEQNRDANEIVEASKAFLEWSDKQHQHPLLGNLNTGLAYDLAIDWPLNVAAA